jgi:threonine/homoserine/homoserine lactone efflux protein
MISVEFLLTSFVVILLPGTGVLYTLAIGLGRGFRPSVAAALGCTFGIVPAAIASIVGLAALLHTSAVAFQFLKYLGVIYLLYMAWKILRDSGTHEISGHTHTDSLARIAVTGTLLNVLNPKLSLFFLAFLPQFVSTDAVNPTFSLAVMAGIFMAMTFIVFVVYGAFASLTRDYVIRRPAVMRWIKRAFAGTFGFLAMKLAVTER